MSGISLKAFIPGIAKVVDMTPAALYERQRALVRAGLLHSEGGRGPGSGVRATPESVAMLLISLVATGSLSEAEHQTRVVANLKSKMKRCPLTGKKTFASALTAILTSEELGKRVPWLWVERGSLGAAAAIVFDDIANDEPKDSEFGPHGDPGKSKLYVQAHLALPFDEIARRLKEATK